MRSGPYVVCLGEALIDFVSLGDGESGLPVFEQNPGGAPANVARNLARLGTPAAFVGAVGADPFGSFLRKVMVADGVDAAAMVTVAGAPTTLAFVHLAPDGERSFSFVRSPGADTKLCAGDVPHSLIAKAAALHVGSLSFTHEESSQAAWHALDVAAYANVTISCDVNLRPLLWDDLARARDAIKTLLARCQFAKLSLEELNFVLNDALDIGPLSRARRLVALFPNVGLLALTMGAEGSLVLAREESGLLQIIEVPGVIVDVVDTTGAGDTYCAAMLHRIVAAGGLRQLIAGDNALAEAARFAGALAATSVTKRGAVTIGGAGRH